MTSSSYFILPLQFACTSSDDSSSCTDSESVRHRYRPGIRMGTRRDTPHSDPDYTSSSEQSCDTVIYRGPHSRHLSDHELTDNEHPPPMLPLSPQMRANRLPKTQPRTVPTFSRSRSSGEEGSESERSSASGSRAQDDSRLPRAQSHSNRAQKSPLRAGEHGAHKSYIKKMAIMHKFGQSKQEPQFELWVDGPLQQEQSERWVDGPIANGAKPVEQWVDGPTEFMVQNQPQPPPQFQAPPPPPPDSGLMSRLPRSNVLETIEESKHETNTLEKQTHKQKVAPHQPSQPSHTPALPKTAFISDWLNKHDGVDVTDAVATSSPIPAHSSRSSSGKRAASKATERLKSRSASNSPRASPSRSKVDQRTVTSSQRSESRTLCDGQEAQPMSVTDAHKPSDVIPKTDAIAPRTSPPRLDAATCNLADVSMSSSMVSRILNDLDQSVDSDAASLRAGSVSGSLSNLLLLGNRDSVYELQMDAQLETSRASLRNSFHSDEDAWSLGSFPRDDDVRIESEHDKRLAAIRYANLTNQMLDAIQVPSLPQDPHATPTHAPAHEPLTSTSCKMSTLDSGNGTQLDNSFATSNTDFDDAYVTSGVDLDASSTGVSTLDSMHNCHGRLLQGVTSARVCDRTGSAPSIDSIARLQRDCSRLASQANSSFELPTATSANVNNNGSNGSHLPTPARAGSVYYLQNEDFICVQKCPVSPSRLRTPDGSSNPNLFSTFKSAPVAPASPARRDVTSASVASFVPLQSSTLKDTFASSVPAETSKLPVTSPVSSVTSSRDSTPVRARQLSKVDVVTKSVAASDVTPKSSPRHQSPAKSLFSFVKPSKSNKSSPAHAPAVTSSSQVVTHRPPKAQSKATSFSSRLPLCSGKRPKDLSPTSSGSGSELVAVKDTTPVVTSAKSGSFVSRFRSKSPSPAKQKQKKMTSSTLSASCANETFLRFEEPVPSSRNGGCVRHNGSRSSGNDSDSGNDSGIVKHDVRFCHVAPAFNKTSLAVDSSDVTLTSDCLQPRMSLHSVSSGHGSDVSNSSESTPLKTSVVTSAYSASDCESRTTVVSVASSKKRQSE